MDPRLLQYYERELGHLSEMGAEFAQQFPKIAGRLGMNGLEVADPYVERLIEGAAFLAARVQLKIDAGVSALHAVAARDCLSALPGAHACDADRAAASRQERSWPGERHAHGAARHLDAFVVGPDDTTACEFRTAHEVTLLPLDVVSASYFSFAPDLPLNTLPIASRIRGGLRMRLRTTAGLKFAQTRIDRLNFYLAGRDDAANKLLELSLATGLGVLVRPIGGRPSDVTLLPPSAIRPVGFTDDEALLPASVRSFQGYRLLQEYFSFPQRYRFLELAGLLPSLGRVTGNEVEIVILFGRGDPGARKRHRRVVPANVLHAGRESLREGTPRSDSRERLDVRVPRRRGSNQAAGLRDLPDHGRCRSRRGRRQRAALSSVLYSRQHRFRPPPAGLFHDAREPRVIPPDQRRRGPRSSYIGSEVFLSLVDSNQAPYSTDLRQLSLQALCTNRDLVLHMPAGLGQSDFSLNIAAPVMSVRTISGPSRPVFGHRGSRHRVARDQPSVAQLSLARRRHPQQGAAALRDLLELYATTTDVSARRQIEGIQAVNVKRVVRRLPTRGPIAFGRGLEITVDVDEMAFEGGSAFLLGAVLERHFARYVSINSVTEMVLRSQSRGEINRWTPNWGTRPTL